MREASVPCASAELDDVATPAGEPTGGVGLASGVGRLIVTVVDADLASMLAPYVRDVAVQMKLDPERGEPG